MHGTFALLHALATVPFTVWTTKWNLIRWWIYHPSSQPTQLTTDSPAPSTKSATVRRMFTLGHPALGGSPSPMGFSPACCTNSTASMPTACKKERSQRGRKGKSKQHLEI